METTKTRTKLECTCGAKEFMTQDKKLIEIYKENKKNPKIQWKITKTYIKNSEEKPIKCYKCGTGYKIGQLNEINTYQKQGD